VGVLGETMAQYNVIISVSAAARSVKR